MVDLDLKKVVKELKAIKGTRSGAAFAGTFE
jgi:hypothetical protein